MNHSQLAAAGDILVVDDTIENLNFLLEVLTKAGYRVRPARSGDLALRSVHAKAPALILLDIRMPGMDGFEVCRRLKADETTRHIPVIFASAVSDTAEKVKGFELGAVDYVTKPLNTQEVLMRVANHLNLALAQQQLQEQNTRLREAIAQAESTNSALLAAERQLAAYSRDLERLVAERTQALMDANRKLQELSEHDGLTGIANRRKFDTVWQDEWERALRQDMSLAVIMIDIDHFKAFNDYYGHQSGDVCLQRVAKAIEAKVQRSSDLVARYGGEEFVVILPCIAEEDALHVAESIRAAVEALGILHAQNSAAPVVTISLGVAYWVPGRERHSVNLLAEADERLYQAKRAGRNRVAGGA
ncbi:MAG: diguanylate cyclase [Gallionella sp.]|nr:MAG: diguanylate cyclase [Gallionella sp.]